MYEAARQNERSPWYHIAVHRLGWVYFDLGDRTKAHTLLTALAADGPLAEQARADLAYFECQRAAP